MSLIRKHVKVKNKSHGFLMPINEVYTQYERYNSEEIVHRLEKFKSDVGTWDKVASELKINRRCLMRWKKKKIMRQNTIRLLDLLLQLKGYSVDVDYLSKSGLGTKIKSDK